MKTPESRRRRMLSDSEKRKYVHRQAQSGKTLAAFCRDEGLALSSFQSWKKKFSGRGVFIEVAAPVQTFPMPVEVVLVSGDRVVTSSDCAPSWLAELIHLGFALGKAIPYEDPGGAISDFM